MLAGIIAMSVAFLAVSGHAWRTAAKNPVEALREE
jgi:cbb3-type cytochrome oxidase subunit 3